MKDFFTKNKVTVLVVLAIIIAITIVILTTRPAQKKEDKTQSLGFPLMMGSKGAEVSYLQAWLNNKKGETLIVDGIYGPLTAASVKKIFNVEQVSEELYNSLTV